MLHSLLRHVLAPFAAAFLGRFLRNDFLFLFQLFRNIFIPPFVTIDFRHRIVPKLFLY